MELNAVINIEQIIQWFVIIKRSTKIFYLGLDAIVALDVIAALDATVALDVIAALDATVITHMMGVIAVLLKGLQGM